LNVCEPGVCNLSGFSTLVIKVLTFRKSHDILKL
jgi:hypothetical protein